MSQFSRPEKTGPKPLVDRRGVIGSGTKFVRQAPLFPKFARQLHILDKMSIIVGTEKNEDNVKRVLKQLKRYKRSWFGAGWKRPEIMIEAIHGDGQEYVKSLRQATKEMEIWHPLHLRMASKARKVSSELGETDIFFHIVGQGGHFITWLDEEYCFARHGVSAQLNLGWIIEPLDRPSYRIYTGIVDMFENNGAFGLDACLLISNRLATELRTVELQDALTVLGLQVLTHPKAYATNHTSPYDIIAELTGKEEGKQNFIGVAAAERDKPILDEARFAWVIPRKSPYEQETKLAIRKVLRRVLQHPACDMSGCRTLKGTTNHIALTGDISRNAFFDAIDPWKNDPSVNIVFVHSIIDKIVAVRFAPVEPPKVREANDGPAYVSHYIRRYASMVDEDPDELAQLLRSKEIAADEFGEEIPEHESVKLEEEDQEVMLK